jgi:hypothetical protein
MFLAIDPISPSGMAEMQEDSLAGAGRQYGREKGRKRFRIGL